MPSLRDDDSASLMPSIESDLVDSTDDDQRNEHDEDPYEHDYDHIGAETTVREQLSTLDGIATVAGIQLGSGIFSSPSAVYTGAGTPVGAVCLWLVGDLIAWTGAKSVAEFGVRVPSNGGLMDYLALCYGWRLACTTSWVWILLITPCSAAILCVVVAKHLMPLLPVVVAEWYWSTRVVAAVTIVAATCGNWNGMRQSRMMSRFFIVVQLIALTLVILTGFTIRHFRVGVGRGRLYLKLASPKASKAAI